MTPTWSELIRPADAQDANYVRSTWVSSYRNSPWAGPWSSEDYEARQTNEIIRLYKRGARVIVVSNPTNPKLILGWLCYELDPDNKAILHYCFVKPLFRRKGIAQSLIKHAGIDSRGEFSCSYRTQICSRAFKNGKYRPELARSKALGRKREPSPDSGTVDQVPTS